MEDIRESIRLLQEAVALVIKNIEDLQKRIEIVESNVEQNYQYIITLRSLQDISTRNLTSLQNDVIDRINNLDFRTSHVEESCIISTQNLEEKIKRLEDITKILLVEAKTKVVNDERE